jgi:SEC-C motif-containing protein
MNCPCGSNQSFEKCCEPFLLNKAVPLTAEALMRSRYTAYTRADMDYVKKTLAPESLKDFNLAESKRWATQSEWKGLKILSTKNGGTNDKKGTVEFVATYSTNNETLKGNTKSAQPKSETIEHHEVAQFRKDKNDHWLFVDAESHTHKEGEGHAHHHPKPDTFVRESAKVGRNEPCTCGSGKKYKKCCGIAA